MGLSVFTNIGQQKGMAEVHKVIGDIRMFLLLFLVFLVPTSASESVVCKKKNKIQFYQTETPVVTGNCEETGLGWIGRDATGAIIDDQFFTKWTDFFEHPDCVDKISVYIGDREGENEEPIDTIENFEPINVTGQNPSNTILITNQPEEEICTLRRFTSRLVFLPKFFDNRNLPCYETTQKITPDAGHPLSAHFLNNEGPVMETVEDNSGVKIFWRRGMMDTCVQAVDWTVNEKTTRRSKSKDMTAIEDGIFIPATCEAQEVMLTYIFSDDSNFHIDDPIRNLTVQAFKKNKECQPPIVTEASKLDDEDSNTGCLIVAAVGGLAAVIFIIIFVIVMKKKREGAKRLAQQDIDENHTYGLYQTDSQENLPTESEVIDENEYYGT